MSTVYVLEHDGLEDDIYVRAVFADEAVAARTLTMDEERSLGAGGVYTNSHGDWCCAVVPYELLTEPPEVTHGPPAPPIDTGNRLISDAIAELMRNSFNAPPLPLLRPKS